MSIRSKSLIPLALVAAASMLVACGGDTADSSTSTEATTTLAPPTTEPPPPSSTPTSAAPTTAPPPASGGGRAQAGAPVFDSFTITSPVTCTNGNAEVTMAYTTRNAVSIAAKVGDGSFASTAGYGPNETGVIVSIPCSGAGSSTVQLKACTEDNECVKSETKTVKIHADGSGAAPATTAPPTTSAPQPPTTDGGGSAQAGAPVFDSFTVTSPATCTNGNAEVTMAYATRNAVSIAVKVGDGSFASTAGYGPNETGVVVSIPCSGAGSSSVQLKACTEDNECTTSDAQPVEIDD